MSLSTNIGMGCTRWTYEPRRSRIEVRPENGLGGAASFFFSYFTLGLIAVYCSITFPFPIDCKPFLPGP